jgi:hypothetical protein
VADDERIEGQSKFDELQPKSSARDRSPQKLLVVRRTSVMAHRNSPLRLRFAEER